ncbi:MAG TPA: FG-GAP repeat protein [Thermodesulfobacteriota bacterium]|nr:FG-GAP repeat protein [Thermodesulfobacteriota bacterium]
MGSMCYKDDVSSSSGWMEEVCRRGVWAVIAFGTIAMLGLGLLPGRAYAEARVRADFNGDGYDDLAIGVDGENLGSISNAGGVNVIYGSANRLTSTGNQFWSQNSSGILDDAENEDRFGESLGK